jgi:glycosyltransferase involved in cell wall biosynthesis
MPTLVSVFGVAPRRIGGTEMFARELSTQLGACGWQSVLCFLSEPNEEVRRFLELPNVTFEVLHNSTDGDRNARRNLARILRKHQPDTLHLHFVSFLTLYPWVAKFNFVRKVFFTDHHSRPFGHVPKRAPLWKRLAARIVGLPLSKVVCVSNYGYQCMTAVDLLPRNRFEMIYNGVDTSRVSPDNGAALAFRRRFGIPQERKIVTQVCWIIPEKGISDFLEMARLVAAADRNVQFVLVGEGSYREQYMKDAEAKGLGDRITWTGMMDDPFGEGVFHAADVVCQFSQWEEVFGWMIAEAMAHAKPVVATRVGGIPELIIDGVSGYLSDRGNAKLMSERVMDLLNNPQARARMGQIASEIVQTKFELRKNVAQLVRSYGIKVSEAEPGAGSTLNPSLMPGPAASLPTQELHPD